MDFGVLNGRGVDRYVIGERAGERERERKSMRWFLEKKVTPA